MEATLVQSICSADGSVRLDGNKGIFIYRDGVAMLGEGTLYLEDGTTRPVEITKYDDRNGLAEFKLTDV